MAAIALVGGYIARPLSERSACENCVSLVRKAKGNSAVDGLISPQDRGGLYYPTQELITVLYGLKKYVEIMLSDRKALLKPMEQCLQHSVSAITGLPVLKCKSCNDDQREAFVKVICKKFMKPLFSNHALDISDRNAVAKMYHNKPLSRKVLKL